MTLAEDLFAQIRSERARCFGELDLPEEFVTPNYDGRSIVNVPASIVRMMGGEMPTPPLHPEILGALAEGVRRAVVVVIDALSYDRLLEALARNPDNAFNRLLRGGRLVPLTSVFPSTTTAALTALWTGYPASQHGFMGYQLFLREQGVLAEMISFDPLAVRKLGRGQLLKAGLEADKFLAIPHLGETLSPVDVPVYNLIAFPYIKSPLSRVQLHGVREQRGFVSSTDMWVELRAWLEQLKDERAVMLVYWSAIDGIAHMHGASHPAILAEVDNLAYSFEREFLGPLAASARSDTLLLITADHGQIDTPPERVINMRDHPFLADNLVMNFAGEPRAAYLYCRNGRVEAVRDYARSQLGDRFAVLDSQEALQACLFGPAPFAPEAAHRVGDLVLIARGQNVLWNEPEPPTLRGRHGSMMPQEMLVPLLAARLDA